jgi:hypothetical protein
VPDDGDRKERTVNRRFLLSVAACVALVAPACTFARPDGVVWSAGHETNDLSDWRAGGGGGPFTSGTASVTTSSAYAHRGVRSARLQIVAPGTYESGARLFRWKEPRSMTRAYYSAWLYFPRTYEAPDWWNVFQFKSRIGTRNDPVWIVNVGNRPPTNHMYLYLYYWLANGPHAGETGPRHYEQTALDLPVGRWVHLEAYLAQSGAYSGHIIVWQDGTKLFDLRNVRTHYPGGDNEWSVDNYAQNLTPSTATIYVDDAAIGTQRIP